MLMLTTKELLSQPFFCVMLMLIHTLMLMLKIKTLPRQSTLIVMLMLIHTPMLMLTTKKMLKNAQPTLLICDADADTYSDTDADN